MMNSRIFKHVVLTEKVFHHLRIIPKLRRTFLSQAYQCQEAWNKRLESSLLKKVKPIDLFMEMDQKFQFQNRVSAVDIDIFANIVQDKSHHDELADVLYKLRMTKETSDTLESTHHAVVRYYLSIDDIETILAILNDRLNYGIFCDYFCYNLLMDHLIKKKQYGSAAQVATFMMLQEEFENPISNALSLYSCHKYLENPDTWQGVDPETLKDEPKEEVKIRVNYLRNPYFDDHFDLWKPSDLVGKTLYWIGRTMNDPLGRSCHLRGLVLYRKFEKAISLLKQWKDEKVKDVVYKEILPLIKKDVPEIFNDEATEKTKELQLLLLDLEKADLYQESLTGDLENLIKKAVEMQSSKDMSNQIELYSKWEEKRMNVLNQNLAQLDKQKRLEKIEEIKKNLVEEERVLTFFENEEKIELEIQQKLEKEKELYGDEEEQVIENDDNYVPPEIVKKRNIQN